MVYVQSTRMSSSISGNVVSEVRLGMYTQIRRAFERCVEMTEEQLLLSISEARTDLSEYFELNGTPLDIRYAETVMDELAKDLLEGRSILENQQNRYTLKPDHDER